MSCLTGHRSAQAVSAEKGPPTPLFFGSLEGIRLQLRLVGLG